MKLKGGLRKERNNKKMALWNNSSPSEEMTKPQNTTAG